MLPSSQAYFRLGSCIEFAEDATVRINVLITSYPENLKMGQEILFCCIYKSVTFSFLSLVDFPVSCLNQFHLFKSSFYSPDLSWFLMQIEISLYLVFSLAFSCIRPCFPLLLSLTPPLPPPHPLLPPCLKRAFPQGRFPFPQ